MKLELRSCISRHARQLSWEKTIEPGGENPEPFFGPRGDRFEDADQERLLLPNPRSMR